MLTRINKQLKKEVKKAKKLKPADVFNQEAKLQTIKNRRNKKKTDNDDGQKF